MNRTQYRQGDILISSAIAIDVFGTPSPYFGFGFSHPHSPCTNLRRRSGRVLADGEKTGHQHVIEADADIELYEDPLGTLWLRVLSPSARILHPEHAPITVPAGEYEVRRQVEYDPAEGYQRVTD